MFIRLSISMFAVLILAVAGCGGDSNPSDSNGGGGGDPDAEISILGSVAVPTWSEKVVFYGDYAYMGFPGNSGDSMIIINCNNQFSIVARKSASGRPVAVNGSYLYNGYPSYIHVYSLADPVNPQLGNTLVNASPYTAVIASGHLYGAQDPIDPFISICNVSSPAAPTYLTSFNLAAGDGLYDLATDGSLLAAAGRTHAVLYNLYTPSSPTLEATITTADETVDVALADNHLYLAERDEGLRIFDVSDPGSPALAASIPAVRDSVEFVIVRNDTMYYTDGSLVNVYDVSDPASPRKITDHLFSSMVRIYLDDYLYVHEVFDDALHKTEVVETGK